MADEKRTPPKSPDTARKRRPAPTIDLTATEIDATEPPMQAKQEAPPEPPRTEAATPDEPPRASVSEETAQSAPAQSASLRGTSHIIAGLAGGAVVGAIAVVLWLVVPAKDTTNIAAGRFDALEKQIRELAAKPAQIADSKPLDDLKERLARIEQSAAKMVANDGGAAERLAPVENAMKAMGVALAALNQRAETIAANVAELGKSANLAEVLQKRIEALESAAKTTQDKVAQNASADSAARLALAAVALRDAVARGEPFAPQLDAVRSLGVDARTIAALEPFAASGVPGAAGLSRELGALLPAMLTASGSDVSLSGGFIERLQANAEKLVRIRPANEPTGDEPSAVLARLEIKTARNDIVGAQADIAKLPAKARSLADSWTKKVEARKSALTAADTLVADTTRNLGKP